MGIKAWLRRWTKEPEFRRLDGRAHNYQTKIVDRYEELLKRHKRDLEGPNRIQPMFERHRVEHLVDIERKLLLIDKYHDALVEVTKHHGTSIMGPEISVYHNKLTNAIALRYAIETLYDAGVPSLKALQELGETPEEYVSRLQAHRVK